MSLPELADARQARAHVFWRRAGAAVVGAALAWFVADHRREIPDAWRAMREARWPWLLLGAGAMMLWLANLAMFHASAQRAVGLRPEPGIALATTAANFLNLVTKSGGMAGVAALLADGHRRGSGRAPVVPPTSSWS